MNPEITIHETAPGESRSTSEFVRRLGRKTQRERYRLEGEIARGGMGAILRIWDEDIRRHIAMKVLIAQAGAPSPASSLDSRLLARFLEEAQITGQLDHPGIVPVHELGLDRDGRVFFTMKLVKGRDLLAIQDLVFEGREGWNETRALSVMLKVCEAVAYAHKKGVIHRDLKPANVMIGDFGEVYVMDWGLARVTGHPDSHDVRLAPADASGDVVRTQRREERDESPFSPVVTMDGDVLGTPAYMPPEQARGEIENLNARSDVYAIGAMLYHLLTRQMPYVPPGARVSARAVLGMVWAGPPTPIQAIRKDVPAELVAITEKAMARAPEERYADTLELAEDLRAYLEHRVVRAHQTGAFAEFRKWVARNRGTAAALAALVLAVIGGVVTASTLRVRAERRELLFADTRLGANLVVSADELWPTSPESAERMKSWLADADALASREAEHESLAAELEGDPSSASRARELKILSESTFPAILRARVAVEARVAEARRLAEQTLHSPSAQARWRAAVEDIAARPAYGGLVLTPQFGILPLAPDPKSGLWEFWHVSSGAEPTRDAAAGTWTITEETGIVLVLIPRATIDIGSLEMRGASEKRSDTGGDALFEALRGSPDWGVASHDPAREDDETFVADVEIAPFFVSKYEMSFGQWIRVMSAVPPGAEAFPRDYPVISIDWNEASEAVRRSGLVLPTEAQWELACRAGTTSPFWTGWEIGSLKGAANVADASRARATGDTDVTGALDDRFAGLAPIDALAPNPFGLHNVHGNVWEWCRDGYRPDRRPSGDDGYDAGADSSPFRTFRGGSYGAEANDARSANRFGSYRRNNSDGDLGLRPARAIHP